MNWRELVKKLKEHYELTVWLVCVISMGAILAILAVLT